MILVNFLLLVNFPYCLMNEKDSFYYLRDEE